MCIHLYLCCAALCRKRPWDGQDIQSKVLRCVKTARAADTGVTVVAVRRHFCRHCSEPLDPMASVDCDAWARARETVHIYGGTRDRAQIVWTHLNRGFEKVENQ
jgi:hypothetical protein